MRYTTIIDITEIPDVYRNHHQRLVYLHLCLRSGYHDDDRDLIKVSLRQLSIQTGLTISAVRHALTQLEKNHLISRQGEVWYVRKFIIEQTITRRATTRKQQQQQDQTQTREEENRKRERQLQQQRQERERMEAEGKTPFMVWYESELRKAESGDEEARKTVERQKAVYESHKKEMRKREIK